MFTFKTEQEVVEAGERIQRSEYWAAVRAIAQDARASSPEDEDAQHDFVHQSVDGSEWIIYTAKNVSVIRFTENDAAYEELGSLPAEEGAYAVYQVIAFWAMRADVSDELERLRNEQES